MKFRIPVSDNVLVKIDPLEECYDSGGLLMCPDGWQGMPHTGTVVATGPGKWAKKGARRLPMEVRKGDRVALDWRGGKEIYVNDELYRELSADDLWGFVEGEVA